LPKETVVEPGRADKVVGDVDRDREVVIGSAFLRIMMLDYRNRNNDHAEWGR
jgi:hypothetical protein